MTRFETMTLPIQPDVRAPDDSQVRILLRLDPGSMAHFRLESGQISKAVTHRRVDELWYVVSGLGEMWRSQGGDSEVVQLSEGLLREYSGRNLVSVRCTGEEPLCAVAVTMPPWPGEGEALFVDDAWQPRASL